MSLDSCGRIAGGVAGEVPQAPANWQAGRAGRQMEERETRMGKDILVVEDEEEVLDFVQAAFEREGYRVQASCTGLLPMAGRLPGLVLLDVLVHPAVGRAFAQQRRLNEPLKAVPLLLFSARVTASQALPGSHLPLFSAHPCHIRALLDAVGTSIHSSSSIRPAAALICKEARLRDER